MAEEDTSETLEALRRGLPQMTEWRRHLHANPETAFEEVDIARYVAERLGSFGVDALHQGLARTGVVAVYDAILPPGTAYWVRLVETALAAG